MNAGIVKFGVYFHRKLIIFNNAPVVIFVLVRFEPKRVECAYRIMAGKALHLQIDGRVVVVAALKLHLFSYALDARLTANFKRVVIQVPGNFIRIQVHIVEGGVKRVAR